MSYSEDFRLKVLSYLDTGGSQRKASVLFSIGTTTLKTWLRNKKSTGTVMGKGRAKGGYKINDEALREYVALYPDAYLDEIAKHFKVTASAVCTALQRLNITRKKRPRYTEKEVN